MKKILSILLLGLLLFNWVGYRALTSLLSSAAVRNLQSRVDQHDYSQDELVTVSIPSALPYYSGSGEFEKIIGEIQVNGQHYNYVQRRVTQDSIQYVCIVNKEKTAIKKASHTFFKLVNDLGEKPSSAKEQTLIVKLMKADFEKSDFLLSVQLYASLEIALFSPTHKSCSSRPVNPLELPPDVLYIQA